MTSGWRLLGLRHALRSPSPEGYLSRRICFGFHFGRFVGQASILLPKPCFENLLHITVHDASNVVVVESS